MSQIAIQELRQAEPEQPPRTVGARFRSLCAEFWLNYFFFFAHHFPRIVPGMKAFHLWWALRQSRVINCSTRLNAKRIFGPGISDEACTAYTRKVASSFFDFVYDVGRTRRMSREEMFGLIESVAGDDRYRAVRAAGKGAIVVTAHMGSFEAGIAALLDHEPKSVHVVFKRDTRGRFEEIRRSLRQRLGVKEAAIDDGWSIWVGLRDALMRDEVVVMQGDRVMPGQKGQAVPFLHGHLLMPNGPVKLAMASGAPLVPIFSARTADGRIKIFIEEAIWVDPQAESVRGVHPALLQMTSVIERYIKQYPEQWLLLQPAFCEDADVRTCGGGVSEASHAQGVVITGAGLISCLGATKEATWDAVRAGRCGITKELSELESPTPGGKGGGQAVELPTDFESEMPREARYLRRAILDAMADAGVPDRLPYDALRCGIILGTTLHGMREAGKFLRTGDFTHLLEFPANAVMAKATEGLSFGGMAATTCSACSSSLGAVALAVTMLRAGELDLVIAGGYDSISDYAYGGFNSLRLVAEGPLRPFAKDRQGMKVSEGYGIVVLERGDDARRRGATAFAEVLGYGESADAHHLTQPHPEGDGAARAIQAALKNAGVCVEQIDLIAAHATGTPDNDAGEYRAFKRVFADRLKDVPVVGFKSHLGHTLGGAGAVELILSAMAMRHQVIPGCASVTKDEVEFDGLNVAVGSYAAKIERTLNTSLGFGGANTCVILGRHAAPRPTSNGRRKREVVITGIGVVLPGVVGTDALIAHLAAEKTPAWMRDTGSIDEATFVHLLNARRVRRMSDYVKFSLAATALAVKDANLPEGFGDQCAVVLGSMHGSANYCHQYYGEIIKQGLIGANPMLFAEGVPNAAAAHLSLMLGVRGACQTVIGSRTAGLDALRLAALRIASGEWDRAIVGAAEEYYPTVNAAYAHAGLYASEGTAPFNAESKGFVTGAGAVTFILESRDAAEERAARIHGTILASASGRGWDGSQVLKQLGCPPAILSSANGTAIDTIEREAIRSAGGKTIISSMYGHIAESFSVGPLAGMAAVLASGKLPRLMGDEIVSSAGEYGGDFGVICTDYTGLISGVRLACNRRL